MNKLKKALELIIVFGKVIAVGLKISYWIIVIIKALVS